MRRSSSLPKSDTVDKSEHGHLQSLSSPILSKINDGFVCFKDSLTGKAKSKYDAYHVFTGAHESTLYIGWDRKASRLVLVFKVLAFDSWEQMRGEKLVAPAWLASLAHDAKVEAFAAKELNQFLVPPPGQRSARDIILNMTGNLPPRRITLTGFCIGGSIATLAATWAAVQWPTADVRCISFGAPAVGNASFVAAFRWLVSLSYRVMFRRDPVAEDSTKTSPHKLKHVYGAVYISNESVQPGTQPRTQVAKGDMGDHNPDAYSGALQTTCHKTLRRERSAGGACRAQMHVKCMLKCPKKRKEAAAAEAAAAAGDPSPHQAAVAGATPTLGSEASSHTAKHSSFGQVDDEGELAETGSNGLAAYVRAGVGNLASDSAYVTRAAVSAAVQALRRLSSRRSSSAEDETLPEKSADMDTDAQAPHITPAQRTARESSSGQASSQFHAVMKNAGLEAPDEEVVSIPQLLGCSKATAAPQAPTPQSQQPGTAATAIPLCISMDEVKARQSSCQEACNQFHAVMKNAGLEALDEEVLSIPELVGYQQAPLHAAPAPYPSHQPNTVDGSSTHLHLTPAQSSPGDGPMQEHANSNQLDNAQASAVMDALEDSDTLEGRTTLAAASNSPVPALAGATGPASGKLSRTFSMLERDSLGIDQNDLSNLQKVLVMGKISQAAVVAASAYRDEATFQRQTGITNSRLIRDREHHDTKVHVGWLEGGTAVFAFRGTATRQDGLQDVKIFSRNIDYLQELYPGVKAHLGFLQQFAAVCHPDRPELNMAAVLHELSGGQTPNRVICCGHSLGGALATLGAAWAALEYPDADVRCISFGSPRVANKVFSKAFNALVGTSLRLVHGFDPVPALPPSMMYKHVPGVIHIRRQDLLLQKRPWHTMFRTCVSDHSMLKYNEGIYRHMPGGLDSLPHFFIQRPVKKVCDTLCPKKAAEQRRKASLDITSQPQGGDAGAVMKQQDVQQRDSVQPDRFWAGPFVACFGAVDTPAEIQAPSNRSDLALHNLTQSSKTAVEPIAVA